jgi:putative tricarboxylic transport membrane protein
MIDPIPHWRPMREIELVAGTPAGGGQDRPARALIEVLRGQRLIEAPMKLTNIPGRGGGNTWDYLAAKPGDGHVLAINSPTIVTNKFLGESTLAYGDLTPLATLYTEYLAFVVRPDSSLRTPGDLAARLGHGTAGLPIAFATAIGNINHMALAKITAQAGGAVKALNTTVFDSARYAVAHVVEGKAELAVITATSAVPEIEAGKLRTLVVSSPQRLTGPFAAVPTWGEHDIDCVIGTWRGVIGAAGLPAASVAFWEKALRDATRSAAWRAELDRHHWTDTYLGSAATTEFLARETRTMGDMLKALGLL